MSFSRNRRQRRPTIEPIQTGHANLLYRSHVFSRRRLSPLSGVVSTEMASLDSVVSGVGCTRREMRFVQKQALHRLHIPETAPNVIRHTSPGFNPVYFGSCVRRPSIAVESPSSARGHQIPASRGDISLPCSPTTLHISLSVGLSANYNTPVSPSCESDIRRRHLADLQRARLKLWQQGTRRFGRLEDADVFVRPLPLTKSHENIGSPSRDPDTPSTVSPFPPFPSSPLPSPVLPSPASTLSRRLSVRAIIHSKSHSPIGLKRDFDLDTLRATIPDPLPSPRSPNFNPKALLSVLEPLNRKRKASCSPDSDSTNASNNGNGNEDGEKESDEDAEMAAETMASPGPCKRPRVSAQPTCTVVPINVQYARAQLPALAAIIMSDRVRRGDMIELALPHPQVWPETIAYVYTGEAQLLSEQTKENILYLGGKI
ncbi:hypothetical protein CFAM422_010029 [Trichoderma lentiforme]|uniref:Uncharacterized protein n=1 Tax=Trichoderma lentiforme TaxID=1567552 RepID=A0A9P5CA24_9HYPO|nr:hypothetical protein CFAM422_010029 [Trichoderma lentiforme]